MISGSMIRREARLGDIGVGSYLAPDGFGAGGLSERRNWADVPAHVRLMLPN